MLEVLRHAVHHPEEVAPWLDEAVFEEPLQLALYRLLVESDTTEHAREQASPEVGDLLNRLLVEEPMSQPFEAVGLALRQATQRRLRTLNTAGAADPRDVLRETVLANRLLRDLDSRDPETAASSAGRLLAWLRQRVGDGG
jgi:hypothetical protein